ncbi:MULTISPECIES: transglutaminase domain-containing protein [Paenibacillus]|uniref:transglutaminase domain-containing protein n=1 Tax=Paenibacillus TaxID=44249 RepID=UPI0011A1B8F2|nr:MULTISPECIES: transglutaminase domain-containing protein [Paenibacillus]MCM3493644.1 transglutaminase domain-containing protein [Paenibacillus lactis]
MTIQTSAFSLEPDMRETIEAKFKEKLILGEARKQELFGIFDQELTEEETWALKYLYAYMPVNDMADYDGELFLSHVRRTLAIRKQVPWGNRVPDHLFLHFVLPYRVNTENIEDSRGILYDALAERTSRLSMKDAILETNYWCHEKATYIGSDLRTISPLTMIRNARGRCGEESTLAVAALRSIGIPARQVYTPRWAHCDSNHAWVEAWADGQWYYIGACEPEARLNQGWFSPPARRAMLINTRIFADYPGPEDITLADKWFTEINLLENYARTRTIHVKVKDNNGAPVAGAEVRFELYNMAELYPIAILPTNEQGEASFKTGYGDVLIRVVKDGAWGEHKLGAGDGEQVQIVVAEAAQPVGTVDFDMVPPPEAQGDADEQPSEEELERHNRRLEEGTRIRTEYEDTFLKAEEAESIARGLGLPPERVWDVLHKARGNSREIAAFLEEQSGEFGEWPLRLLESLNEKDLIDTFRPTLNDHLTGAMEHQGSWAEELFVPYILCPRVSFEMLVPYRRLFQGTFTPEEIAAFRETPAKLADRLADGFELWEDLPNLKGKGNPAGTFRLRKGDSESLDILFVAVCRSLGIPARLHPSEQKPQYWHNGAWEEASLQPDAAGSADREANREAGGWGLLRLLKDSNAGQDAPSASYGENFSLARLTNGVYKTLIYPYGMSNVYDDPFEVEAGAYRLTTGVRLKDGTVRVRCTYFTVRADGTATVSLTFRDTREEIPVLGTLTREHGLALLDGKAALLGDLLGAKGAIAAWIEPEREPTKHLLRELSELAEPLDQLNVPIVLVIGDKEWTASFDPASYPKLARRTVFARDASYSALPDFISNSPAREAGFPHLFVLDSQDQIRYTASGYKIGTGKEALRILSGITS